MSASVIRSPRSNRNSIRTFRVGFDMCEEVCLPQADLQRVVWNTRVYEPSDDSFALVDAVLAFLVRQQTADAAIPDTSFKPNLCVEVGCGSGYVVCSALLAVQQLLRSQAESAAVGHVGQVCDSPCHTRRPCCGFVATDISPDALAATAATLRAHSVECVELVQTDLLAGLMPRLTGAVDLLLFNPPYVPTPDEEVEQEGIARAWAGGHMGRRVTDRLLAQLPSLLSNHGHAFIVTVPENRPAEILSMMEGAGLQGSVVLTRRADEESLQILHIWRP